MYKCICCFKECDISRPSCFSCYSILSISLLKLLRNSHTQKWHILKPVTPIISVYLYTFVLSFVYNGSSHCMFIFIFWLSLYVIKALYFLCKDFTVLLFVGGFLCSPKREAYSRRCLPSVRYLVRRLTLKLLLAFKWNLVYR